MNSTVNPRSGLQHIGKRSFGLHLRNPSFHSWRCTKPLCSIICTSDGLLTSSGNTMFVIRRFNNMRLGTMMVFQLMSSPWNPGLSGVKMCYECGPSGIHFVGYSLTLRLDGISIESVNLWNSAVAWKLYNISICLFIMTPWVGS